MTGDQKIYRFAYGLACFIIAMTFLSGYHKLLYPADFALAVYRFQLLPDLLVNPIAIGLPWLELVTAVCLLAVPRFRVAGLWIALALLLVFTLAIAINLIRGATIGCGCFSASPAARPMDWTSIARNIALIALVLLAFFGKRKSEEA